MLPSIYLGWEKISRQEILDKIWFQEFSWVGFFGQDSGFKSSHEEWVPFRQDLVPRVHMKSGSIGVLGVKMLRETSRADWALCFCSLFLPQVTKIFILDLDAKYFKMYSGTILYHKITISVSTVWQFYQLCANWHTIELLSQLKQQKSFRIFQNCAKSPYFRFWELEYWTQAYLKLDQPTWPRLEPSKQVASVLRPSWLSPHQILKNMQKIVKNF